MLVKKFIFKRYCKCYKHRLLFTNEASWQYRCVNNSFIYNLCDCCYCHWRKKRRLSSWHTNNEFFFVVFFFKIWWGAKTQVNSFMPFPISRAVISKLKKEIGWNQFRTFCFNGSCLLFADIICKIQSNDRIFNHFLHQYILIIVDVYFKNQG